MLSSHQLLPPGGWKFTIGKITLIAENWEKLMSNVRAHKKANGIPEGDIEKDIEEQIHKDNPKFPIHNFKIIVE